MKRSEDIKELVAALAKAQGAMKHPVHNKTAKVTATVEHTYADLASLIDSVRAPLSINGLSFVQTMDTEKSLLTTTLFHLSGQWISSEYVLPRAGGAKELGAQITYGRRYTLGALLGTASEEDKDAEALSDNRGTQRTQIRGNAAPPQQQARPRPTPTPKPPAGKVPGQPATPPTPAAEKPAEPAPFVPPPSGLAGDPEREHIKRLAAERSWSADQVVDFISRLWGKQKITELMTPQYQELAGRIASLTHAEALRAYNLDVVDDTPGPSFAEA